MTIQAGESVEITFGAWEESGHLLQLYYWGQTSLQIEQPVHASIHSSAPHSQGYLVELKLGESCHPECRKLAPDGDLVTCQRRLLWLFAAPKALPVAAPQRPERGTSAQSLQLLCQLPARRCHITAVDPGAPASGTDGSGAVAHQPARNCVPETVDPSQQRMVSFQLKPPALHTPHITCHDPWNPPPPPPEPPSPPPKPNPPPLHPSPPPPPMSVASDSRCSLGGEAVVDGVQVN